MNDALKERLRKVLPWVGFPLFYLVCLVVFAGWTFPFDKLKERISLAWNEQQRATGGQQELRIDDLGSSWVTGVVAKGVRILSPADEVGKPPSELRVDTARARISLLGLLVGNHDITFGVSAFGGDIDGEYDDHGKERRMNVSLDAVDLGAVPPLRDALGIPVEGRLSGDVKLVLPDGHVTKSNGTVALEAKDVAVGDGKAKLKGALALPRLSVGPLSLSGDVKDGLFKLAKLSASGKDLELVGDGRIQLRDAVSESLCDMNLRFKINDAYRSKNDITKSLFGAPGASMPALFDLDPKVKQAKRPDGFYGFHMRGQLGNPQFDPATAAATSLPSSPATRTTL